MSNSECKEAYNWAVLAGVYVSHSWVCVVTFPQSSGTIHCDERLGSRTVAADQLMA